uniref:Protein kinase domain-containing protein n=1 Tax=Tetradesmus obliquus TaxID=3088 RepID=A0A383VTR4_TETOB|eukprot:jgi/Sobl393_1/14550/SZX68219.1
MGGCLSKTSDSEVPNCNGAPAGHPLSPAGQQQQGVTPQAKSAASAADSSTAQDAAAKPADPAKTETSQCLTASSQCSPAVEAAAAPSGAAEQQPVPAGAAFSSADVASTPVFEAQVMQRVRAVLQGLSSIAADGSRASLGQAAAVLLRELSECGADCVILTAAAPGSSVCVMAGCAGVGASSLQKEQQQLLQTDPRLSAALCCTQGEQQPYLYQTAATDELALDWAVLHAQHGLSSFLAMKVGEPGDSAGVVTLASLRPAAFMELWWDPLLNMLSSGLQRLLGHPLMAGMCRIAHELERTRTDDYRAYTILMLQRSTTLLEAITGMTLAVRLGLLSSDGQQLVVQHLAGGGGTAADEATAGPACVPAALPAAAAAELLQLKLAAKDTIFSEAITANAARLVADTSLYGQTLARPGADVFLGGDTEASLVVVPLQLGPGVPHKAALYVLHDKPGNFATAKRPICVLASMLQLLLHKQLREGGLLTGVWRDAQVQAQDLQEPAVVVRAPLPEPAERQNSGTHASASHAQPSTASALVQMLQQQVRNNLQASQDKLLQAARQGGYLQDLELKRVLGKGGFGIVYAGTWKGCPAAVKVMMVPKQQRRVMKGAMEMAVQESLSHPNIVRVFACLFDMVEEAVSVGSSSGFAPGTLMFNPAWLRFRPAGPEDMEAGAISNIMIKEYCEGGTLASGSIWIQPGTTYL